MTSHDLTVDETTVAFTDDFVEEQLFLSEEDFDHYLDLDQMQSNFEHLESITGNDFNELMHWHATLLLNRHVRLRRGWIQEIAQMNDDEKDNAPKGLFALTRVMPAMTKNDLMLILLFWLIIFIAYWTLKDILFV